MLVLVFGFSLSGCGSDFLFVPCISRLCNYVACCVHALCALFVPLLNWELRASISQLWWLCQVRQIGWLQHRCAPLNDQWSYGSRFPLGPFSLAYRHHHLLPHMVGPLLCAWVLICSFKNIVRLDQGYPNNLLVPKLPINGPVSDYSLTEALGKTSA